MKSVFFFTVFCFATAARAELKFDVAPDCKGYGPTTTNLVVTSDTMEGGVVGFGYENLAGLNEFAVVKGCEHPSLTKDALVCKGKGEIGKVGKFAVPEDDSDETPRAPLTLNASMNFAISGGCAVKKKEQLVFEVE